MKGSRKKGERKKLEEEQFKALEDTKEENEVMREELKNLM